MIKKIAIVTFLGCLTTAAVVVTLRSIDGGSGKEIGGYQQKIIENAKKVISGIESCLSRETIIDRPDRDDGSNADPVRMAQIQKIRDLIKGIMTALKEITTRMGDVNGDRKIILMGYLKIVGDAAKEAEESIDTATGKARTGMGIAAELNDAKKSAEKMLAPIRALE